MCEFIVHAATTTTATASQKTVTSFVSLSVIKDVTMKSRIKQQTIQRMKSYELRIPLVHRPPSLFLSLSHKNFFFFKFDFDELRIAVR